MDITPEDLYSGESVILSKSANSVISIHDYGLKRLGVKLHGIRVPVDQLMSVTGFKGKEAVGGRLHLTNYRLIFKSHPINRVKGKFSICLPTVEKLNDVSQFVVKKMEIVTATQTFMFVVWGIPALINAIQSAMSGLTAERKTARLNMIAVDPNKLGGGMQVFAAMDRMMENLPEIAGDLKDLITDPLSTANVLNLLDLWNELKGEGA